MAFTGWRKWLNRFSSGSQTSNRRIGRRADRRPQLELLEQRLAPVVRSWTGASGVDILWSDKNNWQGNVAPVPGQDSLTFPVGAITTSSQNDFATGSDFLAITFTGGNYKLSGNPIQLGNPLTGVGTITDSSGASTNTINSGLNIQFVGSSGTETITATPGTVLTINSKLSGRGGIQLQKRNNGTVVLSGDNSAFTGPIAVSQGALQIQNATALGSNNTTTVLSGATLQIVNVIGNIAEPLIVSGTGISNAGALENLSGNNTLTGSISFGANVLIAADSGQMTLGGVLGDNGIGYTVTFGNVNPGRQGTVVLSNANTYVGSTVVNNGTLLITNAQSLGTTAHGTSVSSGATLALQGVSVTGETLSLTGLGINSAGALRNVSGTDTWTGKVTLQGTAAIGADGGSQLTVTGKIVDGAVGSGLTKEGDGTVVLTTSNTYTGVTTVAQGILKITDPLAAGGSTSAGVVVVGRATLQTTVSVANEKLTLNGPGVNNTGAIDNLTGFNSWSGPISLPSDGSAGAEANSQLVLSGVISGVGGLTKDGPGEVVLTNANTYLGSTDVHAGSLTVENSTALGVFPVSSTLEASTTVESGAALDINGLGGSLTITSPLILAGNGINNTGAVRNISGTNFLTGLVLLTGNTAIGVDAGVSELTMSNDFSQRAPGGYGITKVGPNRLILSGFNRYTGADEVKQGTLTITSDNALGTIDGGTTVDSGAVLEIKGGIEVGNEQLTVSGTGINNSGAVLNVSDDNRFDGNVAMNGSVTIGANVNSRLTMRGNFADGQNGFSLTKSGGGKLTLGGNNTYGGGTSIQAGILNIQSNAALGANVSGTVVQAGASLEMQDNVVVNAQKITLNGAGPSSAENIPTQWFPFGPAGINNVSGGPGNPAEASGRITAVAADPSNPGVYYIGAAGGGIWKTKDGGINWIPLTDNLAPMFIGAIAVSQSDPNVIYAGTGEDNWFTATFTVGFSNLDFYGNGILKSTDGGQTWALLGADHFARTAVSKVVIDPRTPDTVYVSTSVQAINANGFPLSTYLSPTDPTGTGIWKSIDGGKTWTNTTFSPSGIWLAPTVPSLDNYTDLVMDPLDPNNIYAAIGGDYFVNGVAYFTGNNAVYESLDAGASWFLEKNLPNIDKGGFLTGGTPAHNVGVIRLGIGAFVADFPFLYVVEAQTSPSWGLKDFFVDDVSGGINGGRGNYTSVKPTANYLGGQGVYDNVIGVNSVSAPLTVFVGGQISAASSGLLEGSFDPAAVKMAWSDIGTGKDGNSPHTDHHAMAFDPFGKLLEGNDGGIWRLADPTPGAPLWTDLNSNLQITQQFSVAIAPNNSTLAYAGAQDNGTMKYTGKAGWTEVFGGDGGISLIDPNNTNTVYIQVNSTPLRSDDGGLTFNPITTGLSGGTTFPYIPWAMDPANSHRLILGTDSIFETTDQGNSWNRLSTPNLGGWESTAVIESLGISANNQNVIYANAGSEIFVTQDHGVTWTRRNVIIGGLTVNDQFSDIVVDPNSPGTAYIVRNAFNIPNGPTGHVFQTTNFGQTWNDITGNLPDVPTWTLLIDPRPNPHILYVGTDQGVYASTNLGKSWSKFGVGMPSAQVRSLVLDPLKDYIVAGTFGRGSFTLELDSPAGNAGAIRAITGVNTWGGDITMPSNAYVGADINSSLTLSGILSDSQTGSSLTKVGPGLVVINNTNSYSGTTTVNDGILDVQNSRAMGTGTEVVVNAGTLELEGDGLSFPEHLTLNGPGFNGLGALYNAGGNNSWTGNVTLAGNSSMGADSGTVLTVTGIIGDNGLNFGIAKDGLGELVLTGSDTYGGDTTIFAGDVNVQNVSALGNGNGTTTVSDGASLFLQFPVDGNKHRIAGESLVLHGSGLNGLGALRDISGIDEWAGNVTLLTNSAIGVDDVKSPLTVSGTIRDNATNSALSKEGSGRLILTAKDTYSGGTTVDGGYLNIRNAQALGGNAVGTTVNNGGALELEVSVFLQPLVLNGNGPLGDGSLVDVLGDDTWGGTINLASSSTIGVENDPVSGLPLQLTTNGDISGLESSVLTKVGPGILIFPSPNDYFGQTLVAVGILDVRDSQALGAQGGDGTFVQAGAALQLENNITVIGKTLGLTGTGVNSKGALENVSGTNTWQGSIILIGNASIGVDNAADSLIANKVITETVAGSSMTKIGPGTMVLAGGAGFDNTYTGDTNVASGTLKLNKSGGAIAVPANLTIGTGTAGNSATVLFLGDQQLAASSVVTVNSDGVFNLNSHVQTIAGMQITDGTAQTGATGVLTINGPLGMTGGNLILGAVGSQVILGGNVAATSDGPATITFAGGTLTGGTLSLGGANRTFIVTQGAGPVDLVINVPIVDGGASSGITVAAPAGPAKGGVLDLTAVEAYTGGTTVSGGTLLVDGTDGNVIVSGGVLGGAGTVGTVTVNSGGSVLPGNPTSIASTLTTTGDVAMATGSTYLTELSKAGTVNISSVLAVTGNLNLNSDSGLGASLGGNLAPGFKPAVGAQFVIITWTGTLTGKFKSITEGGTAVVGGLPFQVHYGSNSITITRIKALSTFTALTTSVLNGVFGQPITFQANIAPVAPATAIPTGSIVFTVDPGLPSQITVSAAIDPITGNASFTTSTLSVGTHMYEASYAGGPDFIGTSDPLSGPLPTVTINKADTTVNVTSSTGGTSVFGQPVFFTIAVTANAPGAGTPSGQIVITFDGVTGAAVTLDPAGHYTFTPSGTLPVGGNPISVAYNGDIDFNARTFAPLSQTVNKASTAVAAVSGAPNPSVYGQAVVFSTTVTVSSPGAGTPTGSVTFFDGGNSLGFANVLPSGVATLTVTSPLTVGTHNITATYNGDGSFAGAGTIGAPLAQVVVRADTTTAVPTGAPATAVFGQVVTFSSSVSVKLPGAGTPTGTINFKDNGAALGAGTMDISGKATLTTTTPLSVGTHFITATYSGDGNFNTSISSTFFTETVTAADTTISLTNPINPSVFGQTITINAAVAAKAPGVGTPSGQFTFIVDNVAQASVPLDATGKATFTTLGLGVGTHTFGATYAGDGLDFNASSTPNNFFTQTVNKDTTTTATVTANTSTSVFGQFITLTSTVTANAPGSGTPTGTVTFFDNGVALGDGVLNPFGVASLNTNQVQGGAQPITAAYNGDPDFLKSTTSSAFIETVTKADSLTAPVGATASSVVYGQAITFTTSVSAKPPANGTPAGVVTFLDGTTVVGTANLVGGSATFNETTQLAAGNHTITVSYAGDNNFNASSNAAGFAVTVAQDSTTTMVTSSLNPSVFSASVTFTAAVAASGPGSGTPTGSVTFTIDNTAQPSVTLDATGHAVFSTSTLKGGLHSVTVSYGGDANFKTSNTVTALAEQVNQASSTTAVVSSVDPSVFGQSVTFTATVSPTAPATGTPTGQVTFSVDNTPKGTVTLDAAGKATFTPSAPLSVGTHSITVIYGADQNFGASSTTTPLSQVVGLDNTSISAPTASPASPVFGQAITFSATVTVQSPGIGTPSGTVNFLDNSTVIGSGLLNAAGTASFTTTSPLLVGGHSITAAYAGNGTYNPSGSAATALTVAKDNSTTTVNGSSVSPSAFGQPVTFTATVAAAAPGSGTPGGTVTFLDGTKVLGTGTLSNGSATYTTTIGQLAVGTHTIAATYSGDGSFNSGSAVSTFVQTVNKAATTAGTVTSSVTPAVFGQSVTFTVIISPTAPGAGVPTGTVTFSDGATALGTGSLTAGTATFTTTTALSVGAHTITANYAGDGSFNGSQSTGSQTVTQDAVSVTLASSANPSVSGQAVTLTATVAAKAPGSGIPSGSVTFTVDSTTTAVALDATGKATLTLSKLTTASHSISVNYGGDTNFLSGSTASALTQVVARDGTTVSLSTSNTSAVFGQTVTLTTTVTAAAPGSGAPTGNVLFFDGSTQIGSGTLSAASANSSVATFSISFSVGSHFLKASYGGDSNFSSSTMTASVPLPVNTADTSTTIGESTNFVIAGRPMTFTATVSAVAPGSGIPGGTVSFFDGATQIGSAALVGGSASIQSSFTAGTHNVTATYVGDGSFNASSSVTPAVVSVGTLNQAFVAQVYHDLLHRPVDAGGLAGWTAALNGGASRTAVVRGVEASLEYRAIEVNNLYNEFLHRNGDAAGILGYANALATATVEQVASALVASPEYLNSARVHNDNNSWLAAIAQDALGVGQSFTPQEQSILLLLLQNFTPRDKVALLAFRSNEAESALVSTYYPLYLHRAADAGGVAGYVNSIISQNTRQEDVIAQIMGSTEYFSRL